MSFFLVTRVLDSSSLYYINTEIFGDVEIRNIKHDFEIEKQALQKVTQSQFSGNIKVSDYDFSNRISVIVEAENETKAIILANDKFIPVLDLKANELLLANINLSKIGVIRNLDNGILNSFLINGVKKSGVFMRNISEIQRWSQINLILHNDSGSEEKNDLSSRYIKSLHWSHHASDEENKQLKVIFSYFCLEALFKEGEGDNITTMVRCFLGFPGGKGRHLADIDQSIIKRLKNDDDYVSLIKEIPVYLDDIRQFRNDSVHAGFRSIDISNEKLRFYEIILNLAKHRCLQAVELSIIEGDIKNPSDFKKNAGMLFNKIIKVDDILNRVVYSLKNDKDYDILIIK